MNTKILIVDNHRIIREGLRALLGKQEGMVVVGEAEDGQEAVDLVRKLAPDVVIMDVAMPKMSGFEATRAIIAEKLPGKVIALSMHSDKRFVAEMLKAGASGYLLKDCAFDELINAIHAVLSGKIYLGPGVEAA